MLDILQKAAAFVFVLGVLIAFHEFGHFWVARKLGVKVLRFSVGFGKPLLRYQANADSPEYVLAALPLGGYVKMLDEREGEVPASQQHLAFNRQKVWKRIAIVAAGPVFNLILAVALFAATYIIGINSLKPVLAEPAVGTAAYHAGLHKGDTIISVNDQPVVTWSDFNLAVIDAAIDDSHIDLVVRGQGATARDIGLDIGDLKILGKQGAGIDEIGLSLIDLTMPTIIGGVVAGGPAAQAGLIAGDKIVSISGEAVTQWSDIVAKVQPFPNQQLAVVIERDGQAQAFELVTNAAESKGKKIGLLGVTSAKSPHFVKAQYGVLKSLSLGLQKTIDVSALTVKTLGLLLTGQASLKNISGPISIADAAGKSAQIGMVYLISMMGFISVSLGILNLLPIPILDGGHLLFYTLELVKGSPVSERVMLMGQQVGVVMLGAMMCLAFYNDLTRIFG